MPASRLQAILAAPLTALAVASRPPTLQAMPTAAPAASRPRAAGSRKRAKTRDATAPTTGIPRAGTTASKSAGAAWPPWCGTPACATGIGTNERALAVSAWPHTLGFARRREILGRDVETILPASTRSARRTAITVLNYSSAAWPAAPSVLTGAGAGSSPAGEGPGDFALRRLPRASPVPQGEAPEGRSLRARHRGQT
jgi:hypothetical protein